MTGAVLLGGDCFKHDCHSRRARMAHVLYASSGKMSSYAGGSWLDTGQEKGKQRLSSGSVSEYPGRSMDGCPPRCTSAPVSSNT